MQTSNSYLKLKNYFEELVNKSNFLNDFSGFFQRELSNKRHELDSPCLALFGYSLGIDGGEMSSTAIRKVSFAIMITGVPAGDYEAQYKAIDESEQLALKVVARMKLDNHNEQHLLHNSLIKNSIEIRPFEIDNSGLFGTEVSFNLKNFQSMKVDAVDWNDLDTICPKK